MTRHLLTQITSGIWLIDQQEAQKHFPFIHGILTGSPIPFEASSSEQAPYFIGSESNVIPAFKSKSGVYSIDTVAGNASPNNEATEEKVVAVIPVKDVMIKYDEPCGAYGTESIARWFMQAHRNPNVCAIVIDFDTPGGESRSVDLLHSLFKSSKKPVIGYAGNGMIASAGYWIGSACQELYTTFDNDGAGSIGTYATIFDFYAYAESQGMPVHEIYATKSTEKNLPFREALQGKYELLVKDQLDPLNQAFIDTVKANRPQIEEAAFKGKMYRTQDAISMGLIDGVKTFSEVIERAFELGEESKSNKSNINSNSSAMFGKKTKTAAQFAALIAFTAKSAEERTPEDLQAVNDELQAAGINGFLFESSEDLPNAEAIQSKISELTGEVATLKTKIKDTPAAEATTTTAETADDLTPENKEDLFLSEADVELAEFKKNNH